jgi:positive regulator of sigma E activity
MYGIEWKPALLVLGLVLILPLVPAFAMIAVLVAALVAVAAVLALAGAVLASPYLLVRSVRRRLAERHHATDGSASMAAPVGHPVGATNH